MKATSPPWAGNAGCDYFEGAEAVRPALNLKFTGLTQNLGQL
jgi:hypothetical protein